MATVTQKPITAEEFARMLAPADGSREELVKGEIITMPPPGFRHGKTQGRTYSLLDYHVRTTRLGQVVVETGVRTEHDPDSVRGPDISFWSVERLPLTEQPVVYPTLAPDLCVEILSPHETWQMIRDKLIEYFGCGVRMVWVVDPEARCVTVYRDIDEGRILWENATLFGEEILPGFSCKVAELFS